MTDKDLAEEIRIFFEKKDGDALYSSPVWKAIRKGMESGGRKIKFRNRGGDIQKFRLSGVNS